MDSIKNIFHDRLTDKNNFAIYSAITIIFLSIAYQKSYFLPFARVDDGWQLLNDPLMKSNSFGLNYLKAVFTNINGQQYSPINTLYYNIIYRINGFDPSVYHSFSLFIHIVNLYLVYKVSAILLYKFQIKREIEIAFLVTLIWSISPINVEAVVWIAASKVLVSSFFFLLSFYFFLKGSDRTKWFYLVSFFSMWGAFLSKEQTVIIPIIFCFYLIFAPQKKNEISIWKIFLLVSPFLLSSLLYGLWTISINTVSVKQVVTPTFYERIALIFYCLYFYISNIFFPYKLHYHYPFPFESGERMPYQYWMYVFTFLVVLIIGFPMLNKVRNRKFYFFCILLFFTNLFLVIQIFPLNRPALFADRYAYMASPWLLLALITYLSTAKWSKKYTYLVLRLCFIIYIVYLVFYSDILVEKWYNLGIATNL